MGAEEEIKKVKKRYALEDALSDLKLRQDLFKKSDDTITGLFNTINANFTCMSITLPEDKKKIVAKEIAAVQAKLEVTGRFKSAVTQIDEFCTALVNFDNSLKEWTLLDNTVTELNSWVAKDKSSEGENQFSLEKM